MRPRLHKLLGIAIALSVPIAIWLGASSGQSRADAVGSVSEEPGGLRAAAAGGSSLDRQLRDVLRVLGFTGAMEAGLEARLGRPIDRRLADLGRLLWFDTITGLNDDNSCGGCHSPTNGFGDTQSIAIGIENNNLVGPNRTGPRNQRRTPLVINNVFYPALMWNSRFASLSQDPFDNGQGFVFPPPEGLSLSHLSHLLQAQAFIPPTERNEVAGFVFPGDNFDIRDEVLRRLNGIAEYRRLFGQSFPEVREGAAITFEMFGHAIAEFEFTLAFTNTPLDRFARGDEGAMTASQKRGALLFFGKAGCVGCHAVSGSSNEMFSDFTMHVIGVPQIAPAVTNSVFDGRDANEDFGLEQVTGNPDDRYMFRTAPLRNLAVMPAYMHNGCFTTIEDAVRHHLDVVVSAEAYTPAALDADLRGPMGPIKPVLKRVDPLLKDPIPLTSGEFADLVTFLREGLLDSRALPGNLMPLIPDRVPSGRPTMVFEAPASLVTGGGASLALARPAERAVGGGARPAGLRLRAMGGTVSRGPVLLELDSGAPGPASLVVFDVAGRRVRTLLNGDWLVAGTRTVGWEGRDDQGRRVSRGIYFARAQVGDAFAERRIVRLE